MTGDRDSSGNTPSSAGFAGTFSREGRRGSRSRKGVALQAFAKAMRRVPTEAETRLWRIVRDRRFSGFKFKRQVPLGDYIVDFVCFERRLIVEADGSQHAECAGDLDRDAWLKSQGFRIRRFWNVDILLQRTMIMDTIWADLAGETDL